ncbi:MAG: Trk family potassium uptake protein [Candidatus Desulforudis sp.]|nr:Trk family potassium uptake protein [Desulforudis sp.]
MRKDEETREQALSVRPRKRLDFFTPQRGLLLGFGLVIALGTLLLSLPVAVTPGGDNSFLNALFTATSATCVVGLVVVDTATNWSTFGHVVILGLIQVGGLGFVVVATTILVLIRRRIGLRQRLLIQESLSQMQVGGVVRLVLQVILITLVVEAVFAVVLAVRFVPEFGWGRGVWMGLFHGVSAFNNAGFDLFGGFRSLTAYTGDPVVTLGIAVPVIIGGLGFVVIADVYQQRRFKKLALHSKMVIVATALLLVVSTLVILLLEYHHALAGLSGPDKVLAAFFQALTARSAGFSTMATDSLQAATQFFTIGLMFIGGGPSSVTGGIKVSTLAILVLIVWSLSHGRESVNVANRRIPQFSIHKAVALTLVMLSLVFLATLLLSVTEETDFLTTLFEATSAVGIVGLSMGLTHELSPTGKLVVTVCMFIGRVGPLTMAVALAKHPKKPKLKYPEEHIIIG